MSESPCSSDSVEISLTCGWKIEVYHDIDGLNVDSSCDQISRDQNTSCLFLGKVLEDPVSFSLIHFGMNVEAGMLEFDDFLGEELNSQSRVTKNDDLVYF